MFLTLIPKVNIPRSLEDYRPICLIAYIEILAKSFSTRLRLVIGTLISFSQSNFVRNRNMMDGFLIINEIMDFSKKNKRYFVMVKVNFEKTFDCVSWGFLRYMMMRMGFEVRRKG